MTIHITSHFAQLGENAYTFSSILNGMTVTKLANKSDFLRAKSPRLAGFGEELLDRFGIAQIPLYIDQTTCHRLDHLIQTTLNKIREALIEIGDIVPTDRLQFDIPLPKAKTYMRILSTGKHFELEFFLSSKVIPQDSQNCDVEISFDRGNAQLFILADEPFFVSRYLHDPHVESISQDDFIYRVYKDLVLALSKIGDEALLEESEILEENVRLKKIFEHLESHVFIEYGASSRIRDFEDDLHFDITSATFFSVQTSPQPSSWIRGVARHFLNRIKQNMGSLLVINNQRNIDVISDGLDDNVAHGPIHDMEAPLHGRRCLLTNMGISPVADVIKDALMFDVQECPPSSKLSDLTNLRSPQF